MIKTGREVTVDPVTASLDARIILVYTLFGGASSLGARVAETVYSLLPELDVFITTGRAAFADWWEVDNPAGVVFAWESFCLRILPRRADLEIDDSAQTDPGDDPLSCGVLLDPRSGKLMRTRGGHAAYSTLPVVPSQAASFTYADLRGIHHD